MAFASSVIFNDPTSSPKDPIVQQALNDALGAWSNYIAGAGTLVVSLNFQSLGAPVSTGGYVLSDALPTSYDTSGIVRSGGVPNAAQDVLASGKQIASSDITINFNADLLPTIVNESSYSLVSVFEHELGHGLGISGFRGNYGVSLSEPLFSKFDVLTSFFASVNFVGAAAERVYGGPVPLTTLQPGSNNYHLGATGTAADGSLFHDLMAPNLSSPAPAISALDVAILADTGIPLTAAGQVLINPNASLTASTGSAGGASVSDPVVSGTTQAGEIVTVSEGGTVLGTATAAADGTWAFRAAGLADGYHVLLATVPTAQGTANYGVALILDATTPVVTAFQQILGRGIDPASLAVLRTALVNGQTVAALRAMVANSPEAAADINTAYLGELGRPAQAADIAGWQGALARGSSLATLRTTLAGSPEAAGAINTEYLATVGRSASAADTAGWVANFAAGQSLRNLAAIDGSSPESAAAVNAAYLAELGRPASAADAAGWAANLSNGGSLATLRSQLGLSNEAAGDINATYQAVLGRPSQPLDTIGWQLNLKAGSSLATLRGILATSQEAAGAINTQYQSVLGRAATASEQSAVAQTVQGGGTINGLNALLANNAEAQVDLTNSYQAALGHAPDPLQVAAGQSELQSGFTLAQVRSQVAVINGGTLPIVASKTFSNVVITPETIAGGSGPQMVFGTPDNLAVVTAGPAKVQLLDGLGPSSESIFGFNTMTDLLVIPTSVASSFSKLSLFASSGAVFLNLTQPGGGGSDSVVFNNVAPGALTAANFKFV